MVLSSSTCKSLLSILIVASSILASAPARSQETGESPAQRMSPELLWKLGRLGESTASSNGELIAYTVRRYELSENSGKSTLRIANLAGNTDEAVVVDWPSLGSIQWANLDGRQQLFFIGVKPAEPDQAKAAPQAWTFDPESGETRQVTSVESGIANLKVSPTGKQIAFTVDVKLDPTVTELYKDLPQADARIIDGLMYRHWNAWHDYAYSHLHVATLDADGRAGEATDLMKGIKADCPVPPFGGSEQFNWSPDGREIAFTMKNVPDWAESTNSDVYVVAADGKSSMVNITKANEGYDNDPVYSPDGKYLAFHSMQRASFESDRNRIMILNRENGVVVDATKGLDQTAHGATWMPDSKSLLFTSETRGTNQIFRISVDSPGATQVTEGRFNWSVVEVLGNGSQALVTQQSMLRPNELHVLTISDSTTRVVTHINDSIYANLQLPRVEERWVQATDGQRIHCWVIHPPDFDAESNKKWPMLTYFQGGPQGQIGQWFSYRWNFHLMAANGYVVVAPNRRGLPGFGRKWNDDISKDWGGQAMKDLLSATDSMMAEPYIDKERVAGIGASFGGYTAYWMMGNHRDRFCTLIAHCGVFNLESMYGSTEELFFVNWDLGGPYWENRNIQDEYDQFSPHRFVGRWKTPLLVIHGEKDFRVPITQGMEAFTAAQVKGIPSRFLYYPNEGHWVLSPQNGVLWHRVFFDWLDRYCKNQPAEGVSSNR